HIDNPKGLPDGTPIDARLNPAPVPEQNTVNPETWVMKYIDTDVGSRKCAVSYMSAQLRLAVENYRNQESNREKHKEKISDAHRHFGAALHVLEDFYAHSNFIELTLRSRGHTQVFPWAGRTVVGQGTVTPLVTGMFGGYDTAASGMYSISEFMQKETDCTPGRRSPGAEVLLILLKDRKDPRAEYAESALASYESFQRTNPNFYRGYCQTMDYLFGWVGQLAGYGLHTAASLMDDAQTQFLEHPGTSLDPTHTQLAKDHDDHPLHALAAECAKRAVYIVGRAMFNVWKTPQGDADSVVATARKFFVHPFNLGAAQNDADVQSVIQIVDRWGKNPANAGTIARIASPSFVEHLQHSEEHAQTRARTRETVRNGQKLRHSVRPDSEDDTLDKWIDELMKQLGTK
ncbi:MAG TPA: HET-C-related protein, partial [Polyangiales bacterium]|nr:HET-C-related protein [Polyangiales bacterium]